MPQLNIILDGDDCWRDLESKPPESIIHVVEPIAVVLRPGCMSSGKAAVAIRVPLPDGRTVIVHTSQELFEGAARAFRVRLEYLADLSRRGGTSS